MQWSFGVVMIAALGCSSGPAEPAAESFPDAPLATMTTDDGALSVAIRTSPAQPQIGRAHV